MNEVPWIDSTKWNPDFWYPLAVSSVWTDPKKCTVIDGYDIFKLSPEGFEGDVESVLPNSDYFNFQTAVEICEAHNGESFNLV